jgi:hypothetical protein
LQHAAESLLKSIEKKNSISKPLRRHNNENVARGNENRKKKRNRKATSDLSSGKMVPWPRSPVSVITIPNFLALPALST